MKLLDAPSQIFRISLTELESLRFPAEAAQFIFDGKARQAADEEWAHVAEQGGTICTYGCAEYPERLKEIYDPPPVLWVRGTIGLLTRPSIAIVGTRHPLSLIHICDRASPSLPQNRRGFWGNLTK